MRKFVKRIALALMAVAMLPIAASAQQMGAIPVDDQVRIGKLDNGLTYYIRHNETPKGQADFYIAQKVGSVLEEDNQRGLAHFLEHMCFNGTKSFPGNSLIDWLESIGVKFGYNLNAYTSIDETVYNISNVPTSRTSVQDSCLLILHDWANDLLLDPEEIDKERGVIHQEWRRSMAGQMRILEKLLPVMYPDNRYGERLPIGTMEVVDNFPPQTLRDYYETWYRPDQQGVIVVGDIDVDYIEGKIKEMFSDIEMPADAKERVYFDVADNEGTIYAIGSDPEQQQGIVELFFKTDAVPDEMKGDLSYLLMKYMTGMISTMLDQRLTDISQQPDAPFAQAGAEYGEYLVAKTKDALGLVAVAKGNDVLPGFETAYRELLRATRGGFTVGEYERAKAEYLSRLEKAYNGRDKRENEGYVNEYVRHFIDNEPIPSIEDEYQIMNQLVPMIPVEALNMLLPELITNDNRVLLVMVPDNGTFVMPTQADFEAIIAKVDAEDLEPYKDQMKEEPLIPSLPAPGKVVSVGRDMQWGADVVTLSNGVKVYVKTTDNKKDEILFEAIAVGGTSAYGDDQANNLVFLPYADTMSGLGDYSNMDLQKYLQGKQVHIDLSLGDYSRDIEGNSTVKDLPTLMELIYSLFTSYDINEADFATAQNRYSSLIENQESNPQFQFQKALVKSLYKSPSKTIPTPELIAAADRQAIIDIVKAQTANAADYTFYFVGDVTVDDLKPLLEQYIATLPADAKNVTAEPVINLDLEITPGAATDTYTAKMETPQTWVAIMIEGKMPYSHKNRVLTSMASQVLSNRLLKKIREEMGAVYSISAGGSMARLDEYNTVLQIPFPMKPELKDEVLNEISIIINDMTQNIADDELNPIKEFMVKNAAEDRANNGPWLNGMAGYALNGVDTFNHRADVVNAIGTADLKAFMQELLGQGNYRVVILDPAE